MAIYLIPHLDPYIDAPGVLLYTLYEGEEFRVLAGFTRTQYEKLLKEKKFEFRGPGDYRSVVYPTMAYFFESGEGYDFKIEQMKTGKKWQFSEEHIPFTQIYKVKNQLVSWFKSYLNKE